jgi:hypothetical protein
MRSMDWSCSRGDSTLYASTIGSTCFTFWSVDTFPYSFSKWYFHTQSRASLHDPATDLGTNLMRSSHVLAILWRFCMSVRDVRVNFWRDSDNIWIWCTLSNLHVASSSGGNIGCFSDVERTLPLRFSCCMENPLMSDARETDAIQLFLSTLSYFSR